MILKPFCKYTIVCTTGLGSFFFLFMSLMISACSLEPHVIEYVDEQNPVRDQSIYISNHGWHTGIIVPSEKVNTEIPLLKKRFSQAEYFEFGWGDADFYRANDISFGLVVQAIFWPTDAVMHVVAIPFDPTRYFIGSEVIEIRLSKAEQKSMLEFIKNSFEFRSTIQLSSLEQGIYGDSQFYRATGNYFMTNTCNKWTAKGLRSAGMDISLWFKWTADSVMDYLDQHPQHVSP